MPLSSKFQVELPKEGIIVRQTGKHKYVYRVLKTFRNAKGQPTNKRVSIGRFDQKSGKLIPNDNYWEYYGNEEPLVTHEETSDVIIEGFNAVKTVGATFIFEKLLENSGIHRIIESIFGNERAGLIIISILHMAINGNVFEHVDAWCNDNVITGAKLTSPASSAVFASITHGERMHFFREWVRVQESKDDYYAYDVTSFSTYARGISDAEFGYNRDGEDLPQINLGCYFDQQNGLPMFYVTYPGSIVDKSHLPYMMAYNGELGVNSAKFVMDKGFCSTANLKYLKENGFSFLMAAENRNKTISSAIDSVRSRITSLHYRIKPGVYGLSSQGTFYGVKTTLHIFFQPELAEQQRSALERRIEKQEETLAQLSSLTQNEAKKYRKNLTVSVLKDGSFSYSRNYTAIDNNARNCGYLCLITDLDITSTEALDIYRRKDVIEKSFDDIKNHADMKRLRTHSSESTNGKLFCAFISLILISMLSNSLRSSNDLNIIKSEALAELNKIRLVLTSDGKRLLNPLTKTQRLIIEACGLTEKDLISYVSRSIAF
jgi:transposase